MRARFPLLLAFACALALLAPTVATGARSHAALREPLTLPADGLVRQSHPNSCGAALLATLLGRNGRPTAEEELIRAAPPGPDGITLHAFASLARARGMAGAWFEAPRALTHLATPFVAHLDAPTGHFVWVRTRVGPFLRISDPAKGEALVHADVLRKRFGGRVFRFDANPESPTAAPPGSTT